MTKYYRVIKENAIWEVGAILGENGNNYYSAIEDIWNRHEVNEEISRVIIEESPKFFQRVYRTKAEELIFKTADELKKAFEKYK